MRCRSCDINIDINFKHAIRANVCPSCGKYIMDKDGLVTYMDLQEVISKNYKDIDAEKLANLLINKFVIKLKSPSKSAAVIATETVVVEEDILEEKTSDEKYDEEYKINQITVAKEKLNDMRKNAYENALRASVGLDEDKTEFNYDDDNEDGTFLDVKENPIERANRLKAEHKKSKAHSNMISGTGGFGRLDG